MVVALTGDVMLGRLVNEALLRHGPAYPWGDVLPDLHRADARIVNLECVIARHGTPWQRWPKVFHFRANPLAVDALKLAKIDCVAIANNHVLDYEEEAFLEMLELLEAAGIAYVGAGRNLEEARRPVILSLQGLRLGVVAFTDNEPGWKATAATPGTNYLPVSLESVPVLQEGIARARAMGAELVIVSAHWGPNMRLRPTPAFREFARAVIEAGADVFHGHSAHVFQGIEVYRGRPILYDCGEFVDDYAVDPVLRNDWGLLLELEVEEKKVRRVELTPLLIDDCQVNRAAGRDFEAITQRIGELSAQMGTTLQREGARLWVECA
ncbi:CapA family protein [Calidithermus roseus]|uniref:Capsule biosynthesis protein CapA n=1 Tax=Calidithermus roseus TaxID=1644118 RepID=A0A399EGD7_9DEIN|nr:CapA family protein [Calidithermus roseus]RIH82806.1 Capsule biosynthesis protein CapA [Calidithermus roseus]